ncbi:MAG: hypothetical protein CMJ59_11350 [Planctomycetaceae bacterium]|nr:hypothetical protein [Planctomycetaceae bacterium]
MCGPDPSTDRTPEESAQGDRRRLLRQTLVIGWLALWTGLGMRAWWRDDSRFGWGMLGRNIEYLIVYHWIDDRGHRIQYFPGDELRDKAEQLRPRRPRTADAPRTDITRYGVGTLRAWIGDYQRFLYANRRPPHVTHVEATLYYAVNRPLSWPEPITVWDQRLQRPLVLNPPDTADGTCQTVRLSYPPQD